MISTARVPSIVVADDNPMMRALLQASLRDVPTIDLLEVVVDGPAAVEAARRLRPDVLLLDLAMPGLDGLEVIREVRAACPEVRIVVLSGYGAGALAPDALALGAEAYIEKGVPLRLVLRTIDVVLGRARAGVGDSRILTFDG